MNQFYKIVFTLFSVTIFTFSIYSYAGNQPLSSSKQKNNNEKIITTTIKSETINVKRKSGIIEFHGNVIVEQDDISFISDKMIVYYKENESVENLDDVNKNNQMGSIRNIEASDNVKIFNDEFVVTGKTGFYDPDKGIFIIEKDVIMNNGTSIAKGQKFVYDINKRSGKLSGKENVLNDTKDSRTTVIIGDEKMKNKSDNNKNDNKNE